VPAALLPPVKAQVQLRNGAGRVWTARVALRDNGVAYLDAPRDAAGVEVPDSAALYDRWLLVWGIGDGVLAYPIRVRELLPSLGAWAVTYAAPPTPVNRQREVGVALTVPLRLIGPEGRSVDTVTREVSPPAVRFLAPVPLPDGVRLFPVVSLARGPLAAMARVLRTAAALAH
jgi:hypothetical protein